MPSHQERVRRAQLPAGYQFGDARGGGLLPPGMLRALLEDERSASAFVDAWEQRTGLPFTPQGLADWIDAEAAARVYGSEELSALASAALVRAARARGRAAGFDGA